VTAPDRPVILVVEDEASIREVIAEMLALKGYTVRLAASAADAYTFVEVERPDAILLDIVLPDAAGTVALDRLRTLGPGVPIIMVTANADEALARETLKRGAFDYVMKPFNVEQLAGVLEAAIASSTS
jgi:DNA-binding NtrC family response regulator